MPLVSRIFSQKPGSSTPSPASASTNPRPYFPAPPSAFDYVFRPSSRFALTQRIWSTRCSFVFLILNSSPIKENSPCIVQSFSTKFLKKFTGRKLWIFEFFVKMVGLAVGVGFLRLGG